MFNAWQKEWDGFTEGRWADRENMKAASKALNEMNASNSTLEELHYEKFPDGTVKCIEDELPFELPEGWEWTRFISTTINRDSERKTISSVKRTNVEKIYDYYGAS